MNIPTSETVSRPTVDAASLPVVKTGKASTTFILAQDDHDNKRQALRAALIVIMSWPRPQVDLKVAYENGNSIQDQQGRQ